MGHQGNDNHNSADHWQGCSNIGKWLLGMALCGWDI